MPSSKRPKRQRDLSVAMITCPTCEGKGHVPNPDNIGDTLRKERIKAGVQAKAVASSMDLSPSFISDVEKGRRQFTPQQIDAYRLALKTEAAKK